jgi:chaperonin GroES
MSQNNNDSTSKLLGLMETVPEIGAAKPKVTLRPFFDRIVVRLLVEGSTTKSGLHIPKMAIDNTPWKRGEVVAVGGGHITSEGVQLPMLAKVGDVVMFFRTGSDQLIVPWGDEELLCIREAHCLGALDGLERNTGLVSADGAALVVPS